MKFRDYQKAALKTDQKREFRVSLIGLIDEAGAVAHELMRVRLNGGDRERLRQFLKERLGNLLWYLASLATLQDLELKEIARQNIRKNSFRAKGNTKRDLDHLGEREVETFCVYQKFAKKTYLSNTDEVFIAGLAGEVGSVATIYKKHLRDSTSFRQLGPRLVEELGDVLWYLTALAIHYNLSLDEIASENRRQTWHRWIDEGEPVRDKGHLPEERFPSTLTILFKEYGKEKPPHVKLQVKGINIGDRINDNSDMPDGYRFHDVFHLAYGAILGWSPVLRDLLKLKRKSDRAVDNNQDGARARILEEAIAAYVFNLAPECFDGMDYVDGQILQTIKGLTKNLEVSQCTEKRWERAILVGFGVFRELKANGGGSVFVDFQREKIRFLRPRRRVG